MKIDTKYKIGDEVYLITYAVPHIEIFKDTIKEIVISKDNIYYYLDEFFDKATEDALVLVTDEQGLLEKIKELSNYE